MERNKQHFRRRVSLGGWILGYKGSSTGMAKFSTVTCLQDLIRVDRLSNVHDLLHLLPKVIHQGVTLLRPNAFLLLRRYASNFASPAHL